jgi:uncharacterized protein YcbX
MSDKIEIKKLYYSPIKSFNFIEAEEVTTIKDRGIENDRIFSFVRNKTKEEAVKFQNKQYLRNNQSYLSIKNTPILNKYQTNFKNHQLTIFRNSKEITSISNFDFDSLQKVVAAIKEQEPGLKEKEIFMLHNQTVPFYDMINDHVVSLINLESLRDFEARSGLTVEHERFRANIIIDHFPAFKELELAKKQIKIGDAVFEVFCNTPRCKATTYPYKSDISDFNLPQKLNEIYNHIDFGIYLKPLSNGTIKLDSEFTFLN